MNATAPAAIPGRRPFSTGAPGAHIAHGTLNTPTPRPYLCRARNRAQRSQFGCSRPCPPATVLCPVRGACVEGPGPAVCARVATAETRLANFGQGSIVADPGGLRLAEDKAGTKWAGNMIVLVQNGVTPATPQVQKIFVFLYWY